MCLPKSQNTSVLVAVFILFILYRSWHLSLTSPDFPIVYTTTTSSSSSSKQPKLSSNQPTHKKDENEKTDFPKKIWFKLGSKGLSEEAIAWTGSCIHKNPGYAAEYLTDETADAWVQNTFACTSLFFRFCFQFLSSLSSYTKPVAWFFHNLDSATFKWSFLFTRPLYL